MNPDHILAISGPQIFGLAVLVGATVACIIFMIYTTHSYLPNDALFECGQYSPKGGLQYTFQFDKALHKDGICDAAAIQFLIKAWDIANTEVILRNNALHKPTKEVLYTLYQMRSLADEREIRAEICGDQVIGILQYGELDVTVSSKEAMKSILHAAAKLFPYPIYANEIQPVVVIYLIPSLSTENARTLFKHQKRIMFCQ